MNNTAKYRDWDILEELPAGWSIDKSVDSPAPRTVFITNGKSLLSGNQKRALLKVVAKQDINISKKEIVEVEVEAKQEIKEIEQFVFPAKTVNTLARMKFQEELLKEIRVDLMICEMEGWDKKEYIRELQNLLNSFDLN